MNIVEMAVVKKLFATGGGGGNDIKSSATLLDGETKCEEKVE